MTKVRRISEVFQEASSILSKNKEKGIVFLKINATPLMEHLIKGAYHPSITWLLPETTPPFKPAEPVGSEVILHTEDHRLYTFLAINGKPAYPNLPGWKREYNFISLLEKIHPEDAELLLQVKNKKITYPYLTYSLLQETFPNWLPYKNQDEMELDEMELDETEQDEIELNTNDVVEQKNKKYPDDFRRKKKVLNYTVFQKGKTWFNDGTKNYMLDKEEGLAKGFLLGRLKIS